MVREGTDRASRIAVARGEGKADLLVKNGILVDVFRRKLEKCSVAVKDGYIVGLEDVSAHRVVDAEGMYVSPGLIDGHTHIESTFLSPQEFGRLCLTSGVTAVVADPHEIANVFGLTGVLWMIEMSRFAPIRIFYAAPSCVPSSPLESAGGKIGLRDLRELRKREEIVALGEVMDFEGATRGKRDLIKKIELFDGLPIEGHAPGLTGRLLSAYGVSGPSSDHESEDPREAEEKLAMGFHVMVREGSIARNLEALHPFLAAYQESCRVSIVSDDLTILDMAKMNYLGEVLSRGVRMGLEPMNLIPMVTLNTARRFRFARLGAIAPGYRADMVIYENLADFLPVTVIVGGKIRYRAGKPLPSVAAPQKIGDGGGVNLPPGFSPDTFRVVKRKKRVKIIEVTPERLTSRIASLSADIFPCRLATSQPDRDLIKVCVLERHRETGRVGKGFVRGLKLKRGAIAQTFAHDAHNLVVAGTNDRGMFSAARHVARMGGGIAVSDGEGNWALLPLEVGGIVSTERWEKVAARMEKIKTICRALSPHGAHIVSILSFIALPVIPEGRITDKGFIDVDAFRSVSIWE